MQDNAGEKKGSILPPMVTPCKTFYNGKKTTNSLKRTNVQQAESSQDKSVDTNNLERVFRVLEQVADSRKSEEEPKFFLSKLMPSVWQKSWRRLKFRYLF